MNSFNLTRFRTLIITAIVSFVIVLLLLAFTSRRAEAQYQQIEIAGQPNSLTSRPFFDPPVINNSGELIISGSADVLLPSGATSRTAGTTWHNGNAQMSLGDLLYIIDTPATETCLTLFPDGQFPAGTREIRCRGTNVGSAGFNDNGVVNFHHGLDPASGSPTEVVTFDASVLPGPVTDPVIVMQWGEANSSGAVFELSSRPSEGGLNNLGQAVVRTEGPCFTGDARANGVAYLRSDGPVAGASYGDPSPDDPPAPILVNQCDTAVIGLGHRFAVQPNGTTGIFSGRLDISGAPIDGIYRTDIDNPSPTLVRDLGTGSLGSGGTALVSIDINDNDQIAYTAVNCDGQPGVDICRETLGNPGSLTFISNVDSTAVGINNSGTVAFFGTYQGNRGLYIWDGMQSSNPIPVLLVGDTYLDGRAVNLISWNKSGFNDSTEFAASVNLDPLDSFDNRIVKLVPGGSLAPEIGVLDSIAPSDDLILAFGDVAIGSTAAASVTATNNGNAALTISPVAVADMLQDPYFIVGNDCDNAVLANSSETCTIDIEFRPTTQGAANESFDIPSDDPVTPTVVIQITGNGATEPDIEVLDDSPPSTDLDVTFGIVDAGMSASATVTINNIGIGPLQLGQIGGINVLELPFAISMDSCSAQLVAAGSSCSLAVDFMPTGAGSFSDSFDIPSDDPDEASLTFQVNGIGTLPDRGVFRLSETSATVTEADNAVVSVTILRENGSTGSVSVDYATADGTAAAPGDYVSDSSTIDFAAGVASAMFDVQITNDTVMENTESFTVGLSNATGGAAVGTDSTLTITIEDDEPLPTVFNVAVTISADKETIRGSGDNFITYTIDVSNDGPDTATGVQVIVNWDSDLSIQNTPTCDIGFPCFHDGLGVPTDTWVIGDLPSGATGRAEVMATATPDTGCLISDVAISSDSGDADASDNESNTVSGSGTCADVAVEVRMSDSVLLDYYNENVVPILFVFSNLGPDVATAVEIESSTPETLIETSVIPSIPIGESIEVEENFGPVVTEVFAGDVVHASATIISSASEDYNGDNNSSSGSTTLYFDASILEAGRGCFIATAAYGTLWQPNVVTLRAFRDKWLLTNAPGRAFVDFYYRTSPPIADWIAEREWARSTVRGVLTPIVLAIRHPLPASLLLVLGFAGIIAARRRKRGKRTNTGLQPLDSGGMIRG